MIKITKKILSLTLSVVMVISLFAGLEISSFAEDDILNYLTYGINDGEVTITDCDKSISGNVVITDFIDGYPVTTIGDFAFSDCEKLTNITIPDSVKTIGAQAFNSCDRLTSITVDKNNEYYSNDEYGVLFNKEKTKLIQYPIGNSRTEYVIPNSVTIIGDYAFEYCYNLANIIISYNVTTIGDFAFSDCEKLTNITIPDSVKTIGEHAFNDCHSLASITVDENNEYYSNDKYGVLFNKDKTELIKYPIGNSRTEYAIPDSVTTIGDYAFYNSYILTNIAIPSTVTSIKNGAFEGCSSLTEVIIPDSIITIGDCAFECCSSLASITIPDSVTTIGNSAFSNCNNLKNVTIGDSVTTIGDCAFSCCHDLESVTIGNNVIKIGARAFADCDSLANITISDSVTTIGDYVFYSCDSLTSITIPDSVTTIGDYVFFICDSLTSITIPASVTSIGDFAFGRYGDINDGFTIYGYTGSETEAYAKRYDINFVSLDVIEKEELIVTDETIRVDTENSFATIPTGMTAEEIADMIENKNFTIVDKDGNEFDANALIGTGAKIQIISDDGSINEYTVVVSADIDGNGKTTAADARLALRAAAKIDSVDGVYSIAADANGDGKINAMDARIILRKAAGLE